MFGLYAAVTSKLKKSWKQYFDEIKNELFF